VVHEKAAIFAQYAGVRSLRAGFAQSQFVISVFACRAASHRGGVSRRLGNQIRGGISLDGRHFGLIGTNFEHHRSKSSLVGIIRGSRHDVAGHLRGGACGVGRGVCNRRAHPAQSKPPARSLVTPSYCSSPAIWLRSEQDRRCHSRAEQERTFSVSLATARVPAAVPRLARILFVGSLLLLRCQCDDHVLRHVSTEVAA
jgi:hypothetical protein